MAILATGQPPSGVVQPPSNPSNTSPPLNLSQTNPQTLNPSYKSILHPKPITTEIRSIPAPTFELHHGEPSFVWEDLDVNTMVINEDLQFAVVGKFAYGMPEFHELKKQLPLQLEIKGECCIGFLESRHVLIRLSLLEDYVHLLSRPAYYIKIGHRLHQMRGLKYEVWFDPKEETSIGVAWISFPGLPPVFFGKESVFSLARAVGRPLQLDAATLSKSRPSCAKVKVEVDLVAHRPQRIRIGIKNSSNDEIKYKWIRVRYDYIPKYCKECKLQGHDEIECYVLHPELIPQEEQVTEPSKVAKDMKKDAPLRVLTSGKIVGVLHQKKNPNAWVRVDSKKKQGVVQQVEEIPSNSVKQGEVLTTRNTFDLLDNFVEVSDIAQGKDTQAVEEKGIDCDKIDDSTFIQNEKEIQVPLEMHENKGEKGTQKTNKNVANIVEKQQDIQTKKWVEVAFKNHPKVNDVGVSVVSGKIVDATLLSEEVVPKYNAGREASASNLQMVQKHGLKERESSAHENYFYVGESQKGVEYRADSIDHAVTSHGINLTEHTVEYRGHPRLNDHPSANEPNVYGKPCFNKINKSPGVLIIGESRGNVECTDSRADKHARSATQKIHLHAERESHGNTLVEQLCHASHGNLQHTAFEPQMHVQEALEDATFSRGMDNVGTDSRVNGQLGSSCVDFKIKRAADSQDAVQMSCGILSAHATHNEAPSARVIQKTALKVGESSGTRNDEHSKIPSQNPCGIKTMSDLFVGELSPTGFCADSRVIENVDLSDVSALRYSRGSIVQPSILIPSIMGNSTHGTNLMKDIYASNVRHGSHSKAEINKHAAASQSTRRDVVQVCEAGGRGALKTSGAHSQSARRVDKHGDFDPLLHQLSPKLSGNKKLIITPDLPSNRMSAALGLSPLNNEDLIPLPKLKLMTAQVNAACLMSGINAPLSVRGAPVAAVDYFSALPVIENTSQQEVPSNSIEIMATEGVEMDGNTLLVADSEDDEDLLDYGEDDETDAAYTENYEEDPADEYIGLRGLLSGDSSVNGDEFDNAQEAASPKNAVVEKQQGSPEKAQVGAEMPLDVGNASPRLSGDRLSEKELLRAAFYSSRSNNSQLVAKNFEPKPHLAHLVGKLPAQEVNIGEDDELDTESTAQNYVNAAANADLSPEKVAEHKKKLKQYRGRRDKSVPPTVGGRKSARISRSKTSGRQ